jgi:hypothetical protein
MLHLVQLDRSYSPRDCLRTATFDRVCQSVSKQMNGNDDVKKTLTLGDIFPFLSGLYFRGKLAYAEAFAPPPQGLNSGVRHHA